MKTIALWSYSERVEPLTVALAQAIAEEGAKPLIVDFNFHSPTLTSDLCDGLETDIHETAPSRGLVDLIFTSRFDRAVEDSQNANFLRFVSGSLIEIKGIGYIPAGIDIETGKYWSKSLSDVFRDMPRIERGNPINIVYNSIKRHASEKGFNYILLNNEPGINDYQTWGCRVLSPDVLLLYVANNQGSIRGINPTLQRKEEDTLHPQENSPPWPNTILVSSRQLTLGQLDLLNAGLENRHEVYRVSTYKPRSLIDVVVPELRR